MNIEKSTVLFSFSIPSWLMEQVQREAERRGLTPHRLMRLATEQHHGSVRHTPRRPYVKVNLGVPGWVLDGLDAKAAELGATRSDIVRAAIERELDATETDHLAGGCGAEDARAGAGHALHRVSEGDDE